MGHLIRKTAGGHLSFGPAGHLVDDCTGCCTVPCTNCSGQTMPSKIRVAFSATICTGCYTIPASSLYRKFSGTIGTYDCVQTKTDCLFATSGGCVYAFIGAGPTVNVYSSAGTCAGSILQTSSRIHVVVRYLGGPVGQVTVTAQSVIAGTACTTVETITDNVNWIASGGVNVTPSAGVCNPGSGTTYGPYATGLTLGCVNNGDPVATGSTFTLQLFP